MDQLPRGELPGPGKRGTRDNRPDIVRTTMSVAMSAILAILAITLAGAAFGVETRLPIAGVSLVAVAAAVVAGLDVRRRL